MRLSSFILAGSVFVSALALPVTNSSSDPPASSACALAETQPPAPTPLAAPSDGLNLVLVAHGQGTQNYTCSNDSAVPVAIGAIASLTSVQSCPSQPSGVIGAHFFVDTTTPDFDVEILGNTELKKIGVSAAPDNGSGDVPWLKLEAQAQGTTSQIKEIYRLQTQGGSAPASCSGQGPTIEVPYSAQYWFYSS